MSVNWGNQLVQLAAEHKHTPAALQWSKQRMKKHLQAGGSAQDDVCAREYKLFAIEVLIVEYQQDGAAFELNWCWDKSPEFFLDINQARSDLQQEVSA